MFWERFNLLLFFVLSGATERNRAVERTIPKLLCRPDGRLCGKMSGAGCVRERAPVFVGTLLILLYLPRREQLLVCALPVADTRENRSGCTLERLDGIFRPKTFGRSPWIRRTRLIVPAIVTAVFVQCAEGEGELLHA